MSLHPGGYNGTRAIFHDSGFQNAVALQKMKCTGIGTGAARGEPQGRRGYQMHQQVW